MATDVGIGPAVVLLHGQPGARQTFDSLTQKLVKAGYRVIVPDRFGYGDTKGSARSMRDNSSAVAALMDRLGIRDAIVLGHSYGGGVALSFAEEFPGRVRGLVLAGSIGHDSAITASDRFLNRHPRIDDAFEHALYGTANTLSRLPLVRAGAAKIMKRRGIDRHQVDEIAVAFRKGNLASTVAFENRSFIDETPGIAAKLSEIHTPTTVIAGETDSIVPVAAQVALAQAIRGADYQLLPEVGHLSPMQASDTFVRAVQEVTAREGRDALYRT